jgi:hypothetical protein
MTSWLGCFGPVVRQHSMVGAPSGAKPLTLLPGNKEKVEEDRSHPVLFNCMAHVPRTSCNHHLEDKPLTHEPLGDT